MRLACNVPVLREQIALTLVEHGLQEHEAIAESEYILLYYLQVQNNTELYLYEKNVHPDIIEKIEDCLELRAKNIPLVHIIGKGYFYYYEFIVNKHVLIPRPETEILVEQVLQFIKNNTPNNKPKTPVSNKLSVRPALNILEIGTGSACISITVTLELLKLNIEDFKIHATDISPEALEIAQKNIDKFKLSNYIQLYKCDLVTEELKQQEYTAIISNPPYINPVEYHTLDPEVQQEPYTALVGTENNLDGMYYYNNIADLNLNTQSVFLELDPARAYKIQDLYSKQYNNINLELTKDYGGFTRFLITK